MNCGHINPVYYYRPGRGGPECRQCRKESDLKRLQRRRDEAKAQGISVRAASYSPQALARKRESDAQQKRWKTVHKLFLKYLATKENA